MKGALPPLSHETVRAVDVFVMLVAYRNKARDQSLLQDLRRLPISMHSEANGGDALVLNGEPIAISDVVTVAQGRQVRVAPACLERLKQARAAMLLTLENGKPVYGITTGVGALRGIKVDTAEATHFNCLLILSHRVSHGDAVPHAVVRATMLCRAQGLSLGGAGMRPASSGHRGPYRYLERG